MPKNRIHWFVNNLTSEPLSLGVLGVPTIAGHKSVDILLYVPMYAVSQSATVKDLLDNGSITIDKKIDTTLIETVDSSNAFDGLIPAEQSLLTLNNNGGGGNPFDQSLNTTDNVQFNQVNFAGVSVISVYQDGNSQNQLGFNLGEQGFGMGYNSNRAIYGISLFGNTLFMNDGSGANGGSLFMDSGTIQFPAIGGSYGNPAYISQGTVDAGVGGGISLFCNATYEMNWQNGVLTLNGTGQNNSGNIQNVLNIAGPITGSPIQAIATLSGSGTPNDGDLIVINYGFSQSAIVYTYRDNPSQPLEFTFDDTSEFYFVTVVNSSSMGGQVVYNGTDYVFTNTQGGSSGNQENGCTLTGYTLTNFTGGSDGTRTVNVNSNLVVNGTLAFTQPYTTLTEANDGINLDATYDTYFLFVGQDNVQFTVNLPDPSTMVGRELTFINTGSNSEFYPSIFGNITQQNSSFGAGSTYNLSNTTVKMLSDGSTWWITSQV